MNYLTMSEVETLKNLLITNFLAALLFGLLVGWFFGRRKVVINK